MDPDANLAEQLRWAERLTEDRFSNDRERCAAGVRLAELVQALDEWIRRGGFVPDRWHVAIHAAQDVTGKGEVR
jgi:hypothetical protein